MNQEIAVFGLGYVGCVSAACMASLGHRVIGVDTDSLKTQAIAQGRAPFFEPGLDKIVNETVQSGRLSAVTDAKQALQNARFALVCVGTPSQRNGSADLSFLTRVCREIAKACEPDRELVVIIRSTVFPGTCAEQLAPIFAAHPGVTIVANPEFLREGCAVKDFYRPSLLVVGGEQGDPVRQVVSLYDGIDIDPCIVSLRTAEMIKFACNAFHAVKIAFANEVGTISAAAGVDGSEVMRTLCRDRQLNISPAYLRPGFAFGGSCLPKDLRALGYRATNWNLHLPLLASVLPSNGEHLRRALEHILESPAQRIGVVGLAFKEDTDDLRESPVVEMLERLLGKGREVKVFDPHVRMSAIFGSNRRFVLDRISHIGRLLTEDLRSVVAWCDLLVLTQVPAKEDMRLIESLRVPIMDLATFQSGGAIVGSENRADVASLDRLYL